MCHAVTDEMVEAFEVEFYRPPPRRIRAAIEAALAASPGAVARIAELEEQLKNAEASRTYWWHRCRDLEAKIDGMDDRLPDPELP